MVSLDNGIKTCLPERLDMTTSKKIAEIAGTELESRKTPKKAKEVAGSALSQRKRKKR
jgi:hypothetical protein